MPTSCWIEPTSKASSTRTSRGFARLTSARGDISGPSVLIDAAASVGLDAEAACHVLASGEYAEAVRSAEEHWKGRGVTPVPSIFIDGKPALSGAQTDSAFETALRDVKDARTRDA